MKRIYLDHAATTPLDQRVAAAMAPYLSDRHGNPSSIYQTGRETRRALDEARDTVAHVLGADSPREVIFTAGGSEADNLAVKGVALASRGRGRHVVTTQIEHHAVLYSAAFLKEIGFDVTFVAPDRNGVVDPEAVEEALRDDTVLISVMHANNEVGTLQRVEEIGRLAANRNIPFHVDAVQTVGHLPLSVDELGCDLLSLSAHKFYGPKGVGALYVRRRTPLVPLVHGGGQEQERRAGTENIAGVVGMATALQFAVDEMADRERGMQQLRDALEEGILGSIAGVHLNGKSARRLPGHTNFSIEGVEGESLLLNLDMQGIEASSGSACTSGSLEASHVLLAMGIGRKLALGSLRFTLGKENSAGDIEHLLEVLPPIVERLRSRTSLSAGDKAPVERMGKS